MSSGPCGGCLGTLECWVCLGKGQIEIARGVRIDCHRCGGTSICSVCKVLDLRTWSQLESSRRPARRWAVSLLSRER